MSERRFAIVLAVVACAALGACSTGGSRWVDFGSTEKSAEEAAPLGGASLDQRREVMTRMYNDLMHFRTSLDDAEERGDRQSAVALGYFVDAYIGMHLDPLLAGEWQSRHPELWGLDADLRLAKADVLVHMRDRGRAEDVLEEIGTRYAGREDMLVHYPVGKQSTLGNAVKILSEK
ncbi:MAG: hypothetical protein ACREBE_06590 [bacterium]